MVMMLDIRSLTQSIWQKPVKEEDSEPPVPTAVNFAEVYRDMKTSGLVGLQKGSKGESVVRLQRILQKWNPALPHGPTGVYDESTARAVALYKADRKSVV